jgi:putative pyruvate formate lyase activating enzyme
MIETDVIVPKGVLGGRSRLAAQRAVLARASLAHCDLCDHHCGVNRLAGQRGPCRAGTKARFFSSQTEVADELGLVPTFAVALSGCDLRCDFCITGRQSWNPAAGLDFEPQKIAELALNALVQGARTVMVLGGEPTIHLPDVLEFVAALPDWARLVWKTNAHASAYARALLDAMFDVWVADFKFGNDVCAARLAKVPNYLRVVRENLVWAGDHSALIVRHLLMPGHIDCCWRPIAAWLASDLPGVQVSLRSGFWPGWYSTRHQELSRSTTESEFSRAREIAGEYQLNLIE